MEVKEDEEEEKNTQAKYNRANGTQFIIYCLIELYIFVYVVFVHRKQIECWGFLLSTCFYSVFFLSRFFHPLIRLAICLLCCFPFCKQIIVYPLVVRHYISFLLSFVHLYFFFFFAFVF